jgi:hypothetical protein
VTVSLPDGGPLIVIGCSPHGMESFVKWDTLARPLLDESTHCIKRFGVPWFEPFGVMENEGFIFG